MVEVVFSDSAKGLLMYARSCGSDSVIGGAESVIIIGDEQLSDEEREAEIRKWKEQQEEENKKMKAAKPLDRNTVISLPFFLSIGDIKGDIENSISRKEYFLDWYYARPWGDISHEVRDGDDVWQEGLNNLNTLKELLKKGENARVWLDQSPDSVIGAMHAISVISEYTDDITLVEAPYCYDGCKYRTIGEMPPYLLSEIAGRAVKLTEKDKWVFKWEWERLKKENAPLRAVINGQVVSVNENFYDWLILNEMEEKDTVGRLIGKVLIKSGGISDYLIATRIWKLIGDSKIKFINENKDRFYSSTIAKIERE